MLGNDRNTVPCEGGTVTSPKLCGSNGGAILESGMDNSPMYYNAFDDKPAAYDAVSGRIQLYDVQMSALFVSESMALQELAKVAGVSSSQWGPVLPLLKTQAHTMSLLVNTSLWCVLCLRIFICRIHTNCCCVTCA